jgi:hypothetical protein
MALSFVRFWKRIGKKAEAVRKNSKSYLVVLLLLLVEVLTVQGRTITVGPAGGYDFNTIQAAIDDANDGDTVLITQGVYTGDGNRNIDFKGKAIIVRSTDPNDSNVISATIVDCNQSGRGFYFHTGEDANSVLDGFTVINGFAIPGGGILCDGSRPTISNCWIIGCSAGGGRSCYGGGICCGDDTTITKCKISSNFAALGGGVAGGKLNYCIISGNRALICGGGVGNPDSMNNCVISGNTANAGGGVWGGGTLINCRIIGNLATYEGGGICRPGAIINCTFSQNSAPVGGGISYGGWLINCILWGNSASEIKGNAVVNYSDIKGGWPGEGNIDADPCFAKPGYWDPNGTPQDTNDDFWVDGDYHLKSQAGRWDANEGRWMIDEVTSLCIDAGNPASPIGYEPFPNGGIINMGAYGGTAEASKSYFGKPPCETIIAGDINGDCAVDFRDFAIIAYHWLEDRQPVPPPSPPPGRR